MASILINTHIGFDRDYGRGFMAADILDFFDQNKDAEDFEIVIASPGGSPSEAFRIAEIIEALGKPVQTIAFEAQSAGTIIQLAGGERSAPVDVWYMIHNPWVEIYGADADLLELVAEEMRELEDNAIAFYVSHTSATEDQIREWMKAETYLSAEELLQYGFITEIMQTVERIPAYEPVMSARDKKRKPFASINNEINMTKVEKMLSDIKGSLSVLMSSKAHKIALNDGQTIEIKLSGDSPDVGDLAYLGGNAAEDGEYETAETGQILMIAGGAIAEIKEVEPVAPVFSQEEVQAAIEGAAQMFADKMAEQQTLLDGKLTAQKEEVLAVLEAKMLTKDEEEKKASEQMKSLIDQVKMLNANMSSEYEVPNGEGQGDASGTPAGKQSAAKRRLIELRKKRNQKN